MNGSQLLYKISNLQYSIRRKEIECANAVKAKDQPNINLNNEALALLKKDLAAAIKEFDSIPADNQDNVPKGPKKTKRWQNFFNIKAAPNKKY